MDIKNVVITGAGSGLGKALAKKYLDLGCHVVLLGRTVRKLTRVTETLPRRCFSVYQLDVSSKQDVTRVFQSIEKEVGPVDLLINNAGVGIFDLAERLNEQDVHHMIDINLKGTIFCTQEALVGMKRRNRGLIVNIVSTAGIHGKANESVYCASKFGVKGFTESLALELKDTPIRVLGAYMGGMNTDFWDRIYTKQQVEHLMDPDDVADIIIEGVQPREKLYVEEIVIKNKDYGKRH